MPRKNKRAPIEYLPSPAPVGEPRAPVVGDRRRLRGPRGRERQGVPLPGMRPHRAARSPAPGGRAERAPPTSGATGTPSAGAPNCEGPAGSVRGEPGMGGAMTQRATAMVSYEDVEAAADFAIEAFGFAQRGERLTDDAGRVTHVELEYRGATVHVRLAGPRIPRSPEARGHVRRCGGLAVHPVRDRRCARHRRGRRRAPGAGRCGRGRDHPGSRGGAAWPAVRRSRPGRAPLDVPCARRPQVASRRWPTPRPRRRLPASLSPDPSGCRATCAGTRWSRSTRTTSARRAATSFPAAAGEPAARRLVLLQDAVIPSARWPTRCAHGCGSPAGGGTPACSTRRCTSR